MLAHGAGWIAVTKGAGFFEVVVCGCAIEFFLEEYEILQDIFLGAGF